MLRARLLNQFTSWADPIWITAPEQIENVVGIPAVIDEMAWLRFFCYEQSGQCCKGEEQYQNLIEVVADVRKHVVHLHEHQYEDCCRDKVRNDL